MPLSKTVLIRMCCALSTTTHVFSHLCYLYRRHDQTRDTEGSTFRPKQSLTPWLGNLQTQPVSLVSQKGLLGFQLWTAATRFEALTSSLSQITVSVSCLLWMDPNKRHRFLYQCRWFGTFWVVARVIYIWRLCGTKKGIVCVFEMGKPAQESNNMCLCVLKEINLHCTTSQKLQVTSNYQLQFSTHAGAGQNAAMSEGQTKSRISIRIQMICDCICEEMVYYLYIRLQHNMMKLTKWGMCTKKW